MFKIIQNPQVAEEGEVNKTDNEGATNSVNEETKFVCQFCGKRGLNGNVLAQHVAKEHKDQYKRQESNVDNDSDSVNRRGREVAVIKATKIATYDEPLFWAARPESNPQDAKHTNELDVNAAVTRETEQASLQNAYIEQELDEENNWEITEPDLNQNK